MDFGATKAVHTKTTFFLYISETHKHVSYIYMRFSKNINNAVFVISKIESRFILNVI